MPTADEIRGMHRALHVACGLPALAPSPNDLRTWWEFLREMAPLDDPAAGGPLTVADIQSVVGEMKRQNKAGQAQWSLRPSKMLRDPEAFRDLVLISRAARRRRPPVPATEWVEQRVGDVRRTVERERPDATTDVRAEMLRTFRELKEEARLR